MDINDLMQAVSVGSQEPEVEYTPIQHIVRLREVLAKIDAQPDRKFERGDILLHRFPDIANSRIAGSPVMFSRWLVKPFYSYERASSSEVTDFSSASAADRFDCQIYALVDGRLVGFLVDSADFDLHPNPDEA